MERYEPLKFALASILLISLVFLIFTRSAGASTVTYTDAMGAETATRELEVVGRFNFRIETPPATPASLSIKSVLTSDDTGQMAQGCYPIENAQTIAVTSEVVVAAQPVVTVTGMSYSNDDCTGIASPSSNPIVIRFVPEAPALLGPLAP